MIGLVLPFSPVAVMNLIVSFVVTFNTVVTISGMMVFE